jgi:hypothetical protein
VSDVQNPPLPDPGPTDGTHEGDEYEVGDYDASHAGEDAQTENRTEKNTQLEEK